MHSEPVQVEVVPRRRQTQALWLVFSSLSAEERTANLSATLLAAKSGQISLDALIEARRAERMMGAICGYALPGRQAVVWPAQLVDGEPESTATALQSRLERVLAENGVRLMQSLVPAATGTDAGRLLGADFCRIADLQYLAWKPDRTIPDPPRGDLTFETFDASAVPRLMELVQATYTETLDCPWLNGVRAMEDVLDGYRQTGVYSPEWWLIVRHLERDVGCLLLADHPASEQCELVYMGLVPEARGRGWGLEVTRHAQWLAQRAGRRQMILAVDAANQPAVAMYSAAGFQLWNQRSAFVKQLAAARSGDCQP